ncbi:MAG: hypothetical protein V3V99_09845 [candidate division Zixibacteria bacterium]
MIRFILVILIMLASLGAADDFIYHGSFLWNDIRDVKAQDNYLYCAFQNGIGIVNLDYDYSKKYLFSDVEIPGDPYKIQVFDDLLVTETESGEIYLVDISNPAAPQMMGSFVPEWEIWDWEYVDNFLYAAIEYDGVVRYDISDPENILFDDSSMTGIRVIDLEVSSSRLFALDDYNGLLIYEPDSEGFGEAVSQMLLPEQAISFSIYGDTIYAGIRPTGYMVGSIGDIANPVYLETRESFIRGDNIFITNYGTVISNGAVGFELIYGEGETRIDQIFPINETLGFGEVFSYKGHNYITYAHREKGFVTYIIDDPQTLDIIYPSMVYASPGPIKQLEFHNSRLHTIGPNNRYEIYDISNPDNPVRSGRLINPPYRPAGMFSKGDTIFVGDHMTGMIFPALDNGFGNPDLIQPFFSISISLGQPRIIEDYFYNGDLIYTYYLRFMKGVRRDIDGITLDIINWEFETTTTAVCFRDNLLYRGTSDDKLEVYVIENDFGLQLIDATEIYGQVNDFLVDDTMIYMASSDGFYASVTNSPGLPYIPALFLFHSIANASQLEMENGNIYVASDDGIFVYNMSNPLSDVLLFSGGKPVSKLAVHGNYIAASDEKAVYIYSIPMTSVEENLPHNIVVEKPSINGYPNPFNPSITLVLKNFRSVGEKIAIDIYDILGRKLRSLSASAVPSLAGNTEVYWDGKDDAGRYVSSGIYLFRAHARNESAFFKAVLVK